VENFEAEIVKGAEKKLQEFAEEHFRNVSPKAQVVLGDAAEEILNYVESEGIDLVILGTHGRKGLEKVVFGKRAVAEQLLVAILCRGHVLLEDVPGVGKTLIARAFSRALGGDFKQIQCTPDLLPSDVLGVSIFNTKEQMFVFKRGPVFANFLLVDEINRGTPRTQSALLEAMAEGQVSIEATTIVLPNPFFMIATQSPAESEGTFPLPEVQKDRFFLSLHIGYPDRASEEKLITGQHGGTAQLESLQAVTDTETLLSMQEKILSVYVEESIKDYILRIILETRQPLEHLCIKRGNLSVKHRGPGGYLAVFPV
jgi:MoxR-like ATPase